MQYFVQRDENAVFTSDLGIKRCVNTSVLGMVAKGMDARDRFVCSTSLRSMLSKEAKTL